jgi:hypothetical protein
VTGFLGAGSGVAGFCPRGHAVVFYIQKYVEYMDTHTELLDAPAPRGLSEALKESFPCSK